jgi:hypothetical protein
LGDITNKVYDASKDILSSYNTDLNSVLVKSIYDAKSGVDHGILSALTVKSFFKDSKLPPT